VARQQFESAMALLQPELMMRLDLHLPWLRQEPVTL